MNFKQIFDKEILNEQYVRKELKIIYELKLDLYKPEEQPENTPAQSDVQGIANNQISPTEVPQVAPTPEPVPEQPAVQEPVTQPETSPEEEGAAVQVSPSQETAAAIQKAMSSVVTEDEASVNDGNKIMRNFEGEVNLSESQKDNIQSFEDILDVLVKHRKDGTEIMDDFCAEIITLCANQQFDQIKQKLDKKSKIWVEIYYGYNKDDSVGLRFSKRQNSDTLTSTMLIDNEIVSAKFSIDKINQKIAEYRNYNAKKS